VAFVLLAGNQDESVGACPAGAPARGKPGPPAPPGAPLAKPGPKPKIKMKSLFWEKVIAFVSPDIVCLPMTFGNYKNILSTLRSYFLRKCPTNLWKWN